MRAPGRWVSPATFAPHISGGLVLAPLALFDLVYDGKINWGLWPAKTEDVAACFSFVSIGVRLSWVSMGCRQMYNSVAILAIVRPQATCGVARKGFEPRLPLFKLVLSLQLVFQHPQPASKQTVQPLCRENACEFRK